MYCVLYVYQKTGTGSNDNYTSQVHYRAGMIRPLTYCSAYDLMEIMVKGETLYIGR